MLNQEKFLKDFFGLCEYYGDKATDAKAEIYWNALKHLTDEQWVTIQDNLTGTRKYRKLPLVPEMLECVQGNPDDMALIALEKVEKAMREVGTQDSICFDDKLIHGVLSAFQGGVAWFG